MRTTNRIWIGLASLLVSGLAGTASAAELPSSPPADSLHDRALGELRRALHDEPKWIKVHAAEALLGLSYSEEVLDTFEKENEQHGEEPQYRIGIWRVLAQATADKQQRQQYVDLIRAAYLDPNGPDATHAVEAAAKSKYAVPDEDRARLHQLAAEDSPRGAYGRWLLAISGGRADLDSLTELLASPSKEVRGTAAYALRHLFPKASPDLFDKLSRVAETEPASPAKVYLISAAYIAAPNQADVDRFREQLLHFLTTGAKEEKYEAVSALAVRGIQKDAAILTRLLDDQEPDVRVAAANAILHIERRQQEPFKLGDWLVLAAYALSMLAIGVYFKRRTKSADDYLLGGRTMMPWAVGLSYFAGLVSTISYLALPGEMIRHGPMIFSGVLVYPLVYLVTGRFVIPFVMRLKVTSAYEILETRLGLSVRMLGSGLFLALRLMWMSVIILATSKAVLVPMLRLDESTTPWVCLILGAVTVAYTSMGGLPAVVWTDVAQTFILLLAAVSSIVLISISLGGVGAWWPERWNGEWDPPQLWFDVSARVTVASVMLSTFVWYVCTAGADQMAIQRYLATRDVRSARRMFGVSLSCDALMAVLLAALGLSLYAYFRSNPQRLPDGDTLASGADRLLPQYILTALPVGASGLVVAGLLAAAMSSLSSGLNSSCSVITVDWIDRFRKLKLAEMAHVRLARSVSWVVGALVVSLSFLASVVRGNLLEVTNKVVNLLTAPLFVLFFLAMFVPWATAFGTWTGTVVSVAAAVGIAYFDWFGLSFLWIAPVSLTVGIVVGCSASLLNIGVRRPMLELAGQRPEEPVSADAR
jgi:solute:Na+ symporter, SSS family